MFPMVSSIGYALVVLSESVVQNHRVEILLSHTTGAARESAFARSIGAGAWLAEHEVKGWNVMAQHQDWSVRTKVSIGENVGVSPAPSEQHGNTVSPCVAWSTTATCWRR